MSYRDRIIYNTVGIVFLLVSPYASWTQFSTHTSNPTLTCIDFINFTMQVSISDFVILIESRLQANSGTTLAL